ncbi:hypothetical protein D3C75_829730 [compost metagenome]
MLAARRYRYLRDHLALRVQQLQGGVGFVDHQLGGLGQRSGRNVGHLDAAAGLAQIHTGIERLQKLRCSMEALAQRFLHAAEAQCLELGLVGGLLWNRDERTGHVFCGQRVAGKGADRVGLQGLPGGVVQFATDCQPVRCLEAGHRAALIAAHFAIDLARREVCAVQKYLGVQGRVRRRVRAGLFGDGRWQAGGRGRLRKGGRHQQRQGEQGGAAYGHGHLQADHASTLPVDAAQPP